MDVDADRAEAEGRAERRAPKPKRGAGATALLVFLIMCACYVVFAAVGLVQHVRQGIAPIVAVTLFLYVYTRLAWSRHHRAYDEELAKIAEERKRSAADVVEPPRRG